MQQTKSDKITSIVDSWWRFLASIKLTVLLLLCLAALSIIGTVIPQNLDPREYVRLFGMFRAQLIVLLDIDNMYHAWWFRALLLMLVINIVICSIDRLQHTWKTIFVRNPKFDLESFRKRKSRREFDLDAPVAELQTPFRNRVAKKYRYCKVVPTDQGFAITAEKGRWTRLGVYAVHLSVVIMLIGGVIGSRYGFEGFVAIPEGEAGDTIQLHGTGQRMRLPFTIRHDAFTLSFYEGTRRPKTYRSELTILQNGEPVAQQAIEVNHPLYFERIGIFQSSYGRMDDRAPPAAATGPPPTEVTLSFRSAASGMVYTRTTGVGATIDIPENLGRLQVERYEPDAEFQGMALGPAVIATLSADQGNAVTVTLPFNYPKFDAMRGGEVLISVAANEMIAQNPERYYTGLQVSYDPGVGTVYVGFVMMIVGCWVAFFMSHQRLVVEVTQTDTGTRVMVSGTSSKNKLGFQDNLAKMVDQLSAQSGGGPRERS